MAFVWAQTHDLLFIIDHGCLLNNYNDLVMAAIDIQLTVQKYYTSILNSHNLQSACEVYNAVMEILRKAGV